MILVATSGYSYDSWRGPFYPRDIDKRDMLSFYAREFPFTEVNSTYYRMPNRHMLYHMREKTPAGFSFVIKAYRGITHERRQPEQDVALFREALTPLLESGRLACVLLQFPYSFRADSEGRDYLVKLAGLLAEVPAVVEFRRRDWIVPATFDLLRELGFGYVCVDEPGYRGLVPPVVRATAEVAYVRFHGRNFEKWWNHEHAWERYDYLYSREELAEWVPRIKELEGQAGKVLVAMNNHYAGQAVINARMLREMLSEA